MKSIILRLVVFCTLLGLPAAFAGETANPDPYAQAVAAYVNGAGQQLHAIRAEVDAVTKNAPESVKQKYAGVHAGLAQSDKMLEELKAAGPKDFDRLKADFERTRDEMIKLLEAVRRGD